MVGASALLALFGSAYFGELTALKARPAQNRSSKISRKSSLAAFRRSEIDVDTPNDFARLQQMRT